MPCKMCQERGKTWTGDDPKCAFKEPTFSPENWNCATMNALRDRSEEMGRSWRDDMAAGSIGYVPFEAEDCGGYVVMVWYKDRGRTEGAMWWVEGEEPQTLTEEIALAALAYTRRFVEEETHADTR